MAGEAFFEGETVAMRTGQGAICLPMRPADVCFLFLRTGRSEYCNPEIERKVAKTPAKRLVVGESFSEGSPLLDCEGWVDWHRTRHGSEHWDV